MKTIPQTTRNRTLFEELSGSGLALPRPDKLTASEVGVTLWELIRALLVRSVVLCNTDHLEDRELYALLWNEILRNHCTVAPRYALYVDMTRTGADEGMTTYLQYYASDEQRTMYAQVYPEFKMPDHVEPPRRRDHLIPDVASNAGDGRIH